MNTIWKYELELKDNQNIEVPLFSKPLSVQLQNGIICIWFLVNTTF